MPAALAVLGLIALKCAVSAWALSSGFTHVSDDDYARVTIAQAFAHAPSADPSGTSWLPFPFWLNGAAMMLFGRSLSVARAVAILSSIAGALLVHRALLRSGVKAWAAWCGVAVAMSTPWSAWLGVATVPEALTASLITAAALTLATDDARARVAGGGALLIACLSRYEAWPVAAVFAAACLLPGLSTGARGSGSDDTATRRWDVAAAALAIVGPCAWMVWNWHAHGDPWHFLARVAAYRARTRTQGGGEGRSLLAKLAFYPGALVRGGPWTMALATVGTPGLFFDRTLRGRWRWPLVATAALVLFLFAGDLRDGAPTHHPERALVPVFWIGATFGVDGLRSLSLRFVWGHAKREAWLVGFVVATLVAWCVAWPANVASHPAGSAEEDRSEQLGRGRDLRARGVSHITVTPCAYEHFALTAAFEAPERVTLVADGVPRAMTRECPRVEEL